MMVEAAAYLGTSLFFGFLLLYTYRVYVKKTRVVVSVVKVPLRTNRTAILEKQREEVTLRRNRLKGDPVPVARNGQSADSTRMPLVSEGEPDDTGFGEDLGSAMKPDQAQNSDGSAVQKRGTGKSRFAALQDAADQFKEIYNRNNKL